MNDDILTWIKELDDGSYTPGELAAIRIANIKASRAELDTLRADVAYLKMRGVTQAVLAADVGLSPSRLSMYLHGHVNARSRFVEIRKAVDKRLRAANKKTNEIRKAVDKRLRAANKKPNLRPT